MLDEKIEKELFKITEEENKILGGEQKISLEIYSNTDTFVFDKAKLIPKNSSIEIRKHTRFIDFPMHSHNYIEMQYVYSGRSHQVLNDKELQLQAGELVVMNQSVSHSIKKAEFDDIIINFIIKPDFFKFLFEFTKENNSIFNFLFNTVYNKGNNSEFLYFKVSSVRSVQECIANIIEEFYYPRAAHEIALKLNMAQLFVELVEQTDKLEVYSKDSYESKIMFRILKYIEEEYVEGSLNKLSQILNLPDYQISRIIKNSTGDTFKNMIQEKRLDVASKLLVSSNLTINEIQQSVGYENATYFYKIFWEKFDLTPGEFRNNYIQTDLIPK